MFIFNKTNLHTIVVVNSIDTYTHKIIYYIGVICHIYLLKQVDQVNENNRSCE